MLQNLADEIRQCYEHAEEWARQAKTTNDENLRAYYVSHEESWLKLARSYELRQRLTLFRNRQAEKRSKSKHPPLGCRQ